jgi:hypothetical protein
MTPLAHRTIAATKPVQIARSDGGNNSAINPTATSATPVLK